MSLVPVAVVKNISIAVCIRESVMSNDQRRLLPEQIFGRDSNQWKCRLVTETVLQLMDSGQNWLTVDRPINHYHNESTTPPLQGHSVGLCLGRKNRLPGGFFISSAGKAL